MFDATIIRWPKVVAAHSSTCSAVADGPSSSAPRCARAPRSVIVDRVIGSPFPSLRSVEASPKRCVFGSLAALAHVRYPDPDHLQGEGPQAGRAVPGPVRDPFGLFCGPKIFFAAVRAVEGHRALRHSLSPSLEIGFGGAQDPLGEALVRFALVDE